MFAAICCDVHFSFIEAPKPYIELSLRTKQEEHSHVQEIK